MVQDQKQNQKNGLPKKMKHLSMHIAAFSFR